jgi:uncharacterized membrane protein
MVPLANTYTYQINGFTLISRGNLIVLVLIAFAVVIAGLIAGWLIWRRVNRRKAQP